MSSSASRHVCFFFWIVFLLFLFLTALSAFGIWQKARVIFKCTDHAILETWQHDANYDITKSHSKALRLVHVEPSSRNTLMIGIRRHEQDENLHYLSYIKYEFAFTAPKMQPMFPQSSVSPMMQPRLSPSVPDFVPINPPAQVPAGPAAMAPPTWGAAATSAPQPPPRTRSASSTSPAPQKYDVLRNSTVHRLP